MFEEYTEIIRFIQGVEVCEGGYADREGDIGSTYVKRCQGRFLATRLHSWGKNKAVVLSLAIYTTAIVVTGSHGG